MILQGLAFYMFSSITIIAAVLVISARNPVHSVLFLILAFFNSAGLFLLLGAEFLAMILVVVYVGAVAVLFMFVVMMLDINLVEIREGFLKYLPLGAFVGFVLVMEVGAVAGGWQFSSDLEKKLVLSNLETTGKNTEALGSLI
ncbi:MAG: NADH-quinone oxidoreductase subunit J, partial [Pseudomonadota bacterium]|nr:NADH-quinone oxidoreductase subunit J [Pseudomonadota bacterium]